MNKTKQDDLSTSEKVVLYPVVGLILSLFVFIENWFIMIFIGSAHSVIDFIPALGFWVVLWFNFWVSLIFKIVRKTYGTSNKML